MNNPSYPPSKQPVGKPPGYIGGYGRDADKDKRSYARMMEIQRAMLKFGKPGKADD